MVSKNSAFFILLVLAPSALCVSSMSTPLDVSKPLVVLLDGILDVLNNIKTALSSLINGLNDTTDSIESTITTLLKSIVISVLNTLNGEGILGDAAFKSIRQNVLQCTVNSDLSALTQLVESAGKCPEKPLVSILTRLLTIDDNLISIVEYLKDYFSLKIDHTSQVKPVLSTVTEIILLVYEVSNDLIPKLMKCVTVDVVAKFVVNLGKEVIEIVECVI